MADTTLQDYVDFHLNSEETIKNDTVKLIANISGIVDPDSSEIAVRNSVKEMMRALVPTASWQFSNLTRKTHSSGREEVSLVASARVSEAENYALDRRAREASATSPMMNVVSVWADTSPPVEMVNVAETTLRRKLFVLAMKEQASFNELTEVGEKYRLHSIRYEANSNENIAAQMANSASIRNGKMSYGSGMDDDGMLANATKIMMRANVRLARTVLN